MLIRFIKLPNNKLKSIFRTFALLPFTSVVWISAQVHAELIIHTTKDDTGKTNMTVKDDSQTQLPPAQLGITPARIDEKVSLTKGINTAQLNQSLTLYNYGTKPKKIELKLIDMDATTRQPIAPSESTLKPFTLINPTVFTIAPNGYQTVRMSIRPPISFKTGNHLAMLEIKQQVDDALTYDADGEGVTVELGSRYGLPIQIQVE